MGLDFGVNAMTPPASPAGSSSAAIAPDKTPASPPAMAPGSPLALLALVAAAGWLLFT